MTEPGVDADVSRAARYIPTRADLEARLLGAPPGIRREEVAGAVGVDLADARKLWRALGFADVGDLPAFTEADVDALAQIRSLVDDGTIDEATTLQLVRAVGSTMARLAEWEAETIAQLVERRVAERPGLSRLDIAYEIAGTLVPQFQRVQAYAWHRHLAAAAMRLTKLGAADSGLLSTHLTVGFADLVGFTRLSRQLEQPALASLVERFEATAADRVAREGARLVKTLGDSVLYVAGTARQGTDVALGIVADVVAQPGLPDLRVGLATGSVITRQGDVYGDPVNRASRLTAIAKRNRIVVDEATAEALSADPDRDIAVRAMTPRAVRGLGLVSCFAVSAASA